MARTNVQRPTELPQNRSVRRSGRLSLCLSIGLVAVFSLMNAGVTNYVVLVGAIGVSLTGLVASTQLIDRAKALNRQGLFASAALTRFAIALPLFLCAAFAILLAIQFA